MNAYAEVFSDKEAEEQYFFDHSMWQHKEDMEKAFSLIVHKDYLGEMASIFAFAYYNSDADAERIAGHLGLNQLHMAATLGYTEDFKNYFYEEQQNNEQNYYL